MAGGKRQSRSLRSLAITATDKRQQQQRGYMERLNESKRAGAMNVHRGPLLMKSKLRVQKRGEVFTPQWVVDKMISIPGIKEKTEDVFATFLEPSAGEGAFLLTIENAKLNFIIVNYSKELWNVYGLWALASIYGIELLEDNLNVARQSMLDLFAAFYVTMHGNPLSEETDLYKSAQTIIWANIVQGNTLTRKNQREEEISFNRWSQVPNTERMVERTTFAYSSLFTESKRKDIYAQGGRFNLFAQPNEKAASPRYAIVDIEQVFREKKENG
jgi:hypothetical protein